MSIRHRAGFRLALLAGLALSCGAVASLVAQRVKYHGVSAHDTELAPGIRAGRERIVVLIASSQCSASRNAELKKALASLRATLSVDAKRDGVRLSYVGVAPEWNTADGLRFLHELGPFDEVIAGRSWLNTGMMAYVGSDSTRLAVPQVVVLERELSVSATNLRTTPTRTLRVLTGAPEILRWILVEKASIESARTAAALLDTAATN